MALTEKPTPETAPAEPDAPDAPDATESGGEAAGTGPTTATRRVKYGLSTAVFVLSLLVILVVLNWLLAESAARFDLTASRAWSLSPQTERLLDGLEEPVEITLLFDENLPEVRALRRQVDDVLLEFEKAGDAVVLRRVDPTDPRGADELEATMSRLTEIHAEEIEAYEAAVEEASTLLTELRTFAEEERDRFGSAATDLDPRHGLAQTFGQIYQVLTTIPAEAEIMIEEIAAATSTESGRPLPDWEGAASVARATLAQRSRTFVQVAQIFRDAVDQPGLPETLVDGLPATAERFQAMGDRLGDVADRLADLPELGISPIAQQLARRNCILVMAGTKATVLRFEELFPPPSAAEVASEQRIDRRFSGEEVIAKGIRRVTIEDRPTVVFCHADPRRASVLEGREPPNVGAVASRLEDLGFEVTEWNALGEGRPDVPERPDTVWVMVPPLPTGFSPEANQGSARLAAFAEQIVAEGRNVLVSIFPDPMVGFGQTDVWAEAVDPLGIDLDAGAVVSERFRGTGAAPDRKANQFVVNAFEPGHPVAEAVDGLDTFLAYPIPLAFADESADADATEDGDGVEDAGGGAGSELVHEVILRVPDDPERWLDEQWADATAVEVPAEAGTGPGWPVVVTVERGLERGTQRAVVVGSGLWFWSNIVNDILFIPPNQFPRNPGNVELLTNSVCWLANRTDWIARSALTRSVPRIESLSTGRRVAYRWLFLGALPVLTLGAGVGVWAVRRR